MEKSKVQEFSFLDMFDESKRKEIYKHYDSIYEETDEERQIFESMNSRNETNASF